MLVVTSNWCVSDGTLAAPPPRRLIDRFRDEVRRSGLRCGFGHDGRYRSIESIDVVLAGDTFDWLVSREWTGDIRPWHGGPAAGAARARVAVTAARRGRRLLATLAGWMRRGMAVAVADRSGRPTSSSRPVPVRVVLLPGDRDRWLEQAASGPVTMSSGPPIGSRWSDGDVTVEHGEAIDPLHAPAGRTGGDRQPTLGESLAVDLVAAFGASLHDDGRLRPLVAGLLRLVAGGSYVDAAPRLAGWLAAQERRATFGGAVRQEVIDVWNRTVARWHRAARRLPPRWNGGIDLAARLACWLECPDASHDRWRHAGQDREVWQSPGWFSAAVDGIDGDAAATVVLGHPASDDGFAAERPRQVVCLGPRGIRFPEAFAEERIGPAAVVVHAGRGRRLVEWLPLRDEAGRGGDDERTTRGVWLSDTCRRDRGIVDAA